MVKIDKIIITATTSKKFSCNKCGNSLIGKRGFIKIKYKLKGGWGNKSDTFICAKCLTEVAMKFFNSKFKLEKRYNEILRKRMLKNLK